MEDIVLLTNYLCGCRELNRQQRKKIIGKLNDPSSVADEEIIEVATSFPQLFTALYFLAETHNKQNPFARFVLEGYFIGTPNYLSLPKIQKGMREILMAKGYSEKEIKTTLSLLPSNFRLVHNHIVLFFSGRPFSQKLVNSCLVRPAKVQEKDKKTVTVEAYFVAEVDGKYFIDKRQERVLIFNLKIEENQWVAIHGANICQKINPSQKTQLNEDLSRALSWFNHKGY